MPRKARQKSGSGVYHVMMRGINRQTIFEDEEDYEKFLQTILNYKVKCGYKIHAYCLMSNHVHLLIKVGKEPLEQIMRRICGSYVYWYNWKYQRVGNLFQDRFKSEVVEDDTYFLHVQRYIHQNPVKAGLVNDVEYYRWSSYNEYIEKGRIIDCSLLLEMFNDNQERSKQDFIEFNHTINNDHFLDIEEKKRMNDEDAKNIIRRICKVQNAADLQQFEIQTRNKYLRELKEAGLSIRQIERLTGINRGVILKA
jgi:REP element-mobilizing transposase RayT